MNRELLLSLVGKVIKVDRGGPESRVGRLLVVEQDYMVIYTKDDGYVYYKLQHIKSVTIDSKGMMDTDLEVPEDVGYYQGADFNTVIQNFRHHWVKVNRGGPEALEGILDEVAADYVTVFSKHEVVHLATYHIKNISVGVKREKEEKEPQETRTNTRANGRRKA